MKQRVHLDGLAEVLGVAGVFKGVGTHQHDVQGYLHRAGALADPGLPLAGNVDRGKHQFAMLCMPVPAAMAPSRPRSLGQMQPRAFGVPSTAGPPDYECVNSESKQKATACLTSE